jgi:hypothetical protein
MSEHANEDDWWRRRRCCVHQGSVFVSAIIATAQEDGTLEAIEDNLVS